MAEYTWTGAIDKDLGKPGNYTVGGSPAAATPSSGDSLVFLTDYGPPISLTGMSHAGSVLIQQNTTGGVFAGSVEVLASTYGGTFNGPFRGSYIYGGIFNGPVTLPFGTASISPSAVFNDRVSYDDGLTWLFSPNSPSVAQAANVRKGASNLGNVGTLQPAGVPPVIASPTGATWTNRQVVIATPEGASLVDP